MLITIVMIIKRIGRRRSLKLMNIEKLKFKRQIFSYCKTADVIQIALPNLCPHTFEDNNKSVTETSKHFKTNSRLTFFYNPMIC